MGQDKSTVPDGRPADTETIAVILGTIGDTTWRMFVPSVGGTLLGVWLDSVFGTKPWLMAGGIVLGLVFAFVLVQRQVTTIRKKARSS